MKYWDFLRELTLVLSLSVSLLADAKNEGNLPNESERVLWGQLAQDGQFPFAVGLLRDSGNGLYVCSASLISKDTVMTAGHCVADDNGVAFPPEQFQGVVGTVNLNGQGGQNITFSRVKAHPGYNPSTIRNDIAFLTISSSLQLTDKIQPICLNNSSPDVQNSATVLGWGQSSRLGSASSVLRYNNNQKLLGDFLCRLRNPSPSVDSGTQICGDGFGFGPCYGDSGGPLVGYKGNTKAVIGVVSFGKPLICDTAVIGPVVYSKVSAFADWIQNESGDTEICIA